MNRKMHGSLKASLIGLAIILGNAVTEHCFADDWTWTTDSTRRVSETKTITGTFTVNSGATMTCSSAVITAATMNILGTITADSKGYGPSEGPGAGTNGDQYDGAGGAGYGGKGGDGDANAYHPGGPGYGHGDIVCEPCSLGSGGGNGNGTYLGGRGGGTIKLNCSGTATISGTVSANGEAGSGSGGLGYAGGGGSGGSIWILADSIAGDGSIAANGNNGGSATSTGGGGGAGGRIHISYDGSSFSGEVSVNGGSGPGSASDGQPGTILIQQSDATPKVEIFISPVDTAAGSHYSRQGLLDSVEFTATYVRLSSTDTILGNVSIIARDSIAISSGALISADYKGYGSSNGSGTGTNGDQYDGAGGAGYGGAGGEGDQNAYHPGGPGYGHVNIVCEPCSLGSGGGQSGRAYRGGVGGGRVKLTCSTIRIDGTVSANGEAGSDGGGTGYAGGGGSGGSVWIVTDSIAGSGSITANGNNGGTSNSTGGGGGGGGRIYIGYDGSSFSGEVSVNGGNGPTSATDGQPGTILIQQSDATPTVEIFLSPVNTAAGSHYSRQGLLDSVEFTRTYVRLSSIDTILGNVSIVARDSIAISSGALISADYKGYGLSNGSGAGTDGDYQDGAGGAGYGGAGGNGDASDYHPGGPEYGHVDIVCEPCSLGSGGGNGQGGRAYRGGVGGGKVKLTCGTSGADWGLVRIDGMISTNGEAGYGAANNNYAGGGGSGGSVWILADSIAGDGNITANGNNGFNSWNACGGGGAGGRVALIFNQQNFPSGIAVSVDSGTGSGTATDGKLGTKGTTVLPDPVDRWVLCNEPFGTALKEVEYSSYLRTSAPSPFRNRTAIKYQVSGHRYDSGTPVTLKIYDLTGRSVRTLVDELQPPGPRTAFWDGKNDHGNRVSTGTYFCRLEAQDKLVQKLIHIK